MQNKDKLYSITKRFVRYEYEDGETMNIHKKVMLKKGYRVWEESSLEEIINGYFYIEFEMFENELFRVKAGE